MSNIAALYMGIDCGTQGVRAVVADPRGNVVAAHSVPFRSLNIAATPGWAEQSPEDWRSAMFEAVSACTVQLRLGGFAPDAVRAISIDGTSGTVLPLGRDGVPLMNGIMYNDPRAKAEAAEVHAAMGAHEKKLGLRFSASFSLPRLLWLVRNRPELVERSMVLAHQADYLAGSLCGRYDVTDYSNALKTGYDLIDGRWPDELSALGIPTGLLPRVVRPGELIGHVTRDAAEALGLSEKTAVVGGSTDGYASAIAAGAVVDGRWASIIGTTFVLKGVTKQLVIDPNGSSYSHRLPSGEWLLGGAANLGGRCLNAAAAEKGFDVMNADAEHRIPTGVRCYPLTQRGERFPFVKPDLEAFYHGNILDGSLYAALMEGVAYAERYALEHMQALGCTVGDTLYVTGGVCRSPLWLRIRASVQRRRLMVPAVVDAAMGSALVAALEDMGSLEAAADAMLRFEQTVEPDPALVDRYDEIYARFRTELEALLKEGIA